MFLLFASFIVIYLVVIQSKNEQLDKDKLKQSNAK